MPGDSPPAFYLLVCVEILLKNLRIIIVSTRPSKIPYFSTGAVKGRSDLSAVKDGRICYIEVKTGTGKASTEQLRFIAVMRDKYGCCAGIARSVEEAVRIVTGTDRDTCNE